MIETMNSQPSDVFVWAWPPGEITPILAGRLTPSWSYVPSAGEQLVRYKFGYAGSYMRNPSAIPLGPGLPFSEKSVNNWGKEEMPAELQDGMPDGWGRRLIMRQHTGAVGENLQDEVTVADPARFMLESSSDRLGAIDFQSRHDEYLPRNEPASIEDLQQAAQASEDGEVPPALLHALVPGTSLGGARPKATLTDGEGGWMVKFQSRNDITPSIQWEHAATIIASRAGIDVPETHLQRVRGKIALLSKRFDRPGGGRRRMVLTARTLLGHGAGEGSYPDFVDVLTTYGSQSAAEIFDRVAFNIAISNNDDHHKNHAAFWDGSRLELTPAYDLEPQPPGGMRNQRMAINRADGRRPNLDYLSSAHDDYRLSRNQADERVERIVEAIEENWQEAAEAAMLGRDDAKQFRQRLLTAEAMEGRPRSTGF